MVAERVRAPHDMVATLDGKSSLGRLGLVVHSTAGVIDAGFDGHITLELANMANLPITVYPGMRIAQLSFMTLTTPADQPYGSGAAGQQVPGPGRAHPQPLLPQLRRAADERAGDRRGTGYVGREVVARWSSGRDCGRSCTAPGDAPDGVEHVHGDVPTPGRCGRRPRDASAIVHLVAILNG